MNNFILRFFLRAVGQCDLRRAGPAGGSTPLRDRLWRRIATPGPLERLCLPLRLTPGHGRHRGETQWKGLLGTRVGSAQE